MAFSTHFFFFFFLSILLARHSEGQCLDDQKKLLLHLKSELVFSSSISSTLVRWNQTNHDDCCQWDGVECDAVGHVIALFLPYEGISGGFGESSSLFRLTYLWELYLSGNDFTTSHIPNQFPSSPKFDIS